MATQPFRLDQSSVRRVMKNIKFQGEVLSKKAAGALFIEGQEVLTASRRIVPTDVGFLKQDSGVTKPQMEGGKWVVGIWYGDGTARDYAVPQHERTDFKHDPGQQAKYLEQPWAEASAGMALRIAARIK